MKNKKIKLTPYEQVVAILWAADFGKVKTSGSDTVWNVSTNEKMEKWVHSVDDSRYEEEIFVAKKGGLVSARVFGRYCSQEDPKFYTFDEFIAEYGVDDNG